MTERPEDAWERLAAVCDAQGIPMIVCDQTPAFAAWWAGYSKRLLESITVPDHIPADPEETSK